MTEIFTNMTQLVNGRTAFHCLLTLNHLHSTIWRMEWELQIQKSKAMIVLDQLIKEKSSKQLRQYFRQHPWAMMRSTLGLEISKISDCTPFTEIFPCSFGESAPSTVVPNHWHISLSYYSTVNILLFNFPSPAILVICQPRVTTVNLSRSLSLNWADTPSCAQPQVHQ